VNPFSERDIDAARQNYLAQEASVKSSVAEQQQIQSQLDSLILGENSQIASLKAQLAEAEFNLDQTVVRAPSDGYVTQVLMRPGTYAAALPMRPVMVFIPDQKGKLSPSSVRTRCCVWNLAMKRKWYLTRCRVRYSAVNWLQLVRQCRAGHTSRMGRCNP
jgi:hypothetical protein